MGSIPLPALGVRPIQQQDPTENLARLLQLRTALQNAPLQRQLLQQQIQSGQQEEQARQIQIQQAQQAQNDQIAFRSAMTEPSNQGKTIGEVADSLASKGQISQQGWMQAKKADIDQKQSLASLTKDQLLNFKDAHAATQELYNNVQSMSEDDIAKNWPAIAQQYDAIPGNNKMPLDPNQPLTKEQLKQFGPFISMQGAYLDQSIERATKQTQLAKAQQDLLYGPVGP